MHSKIAAVIFGFALVPLLWCVAEDSAPEETLTSGRLVERRLDLLQQIVEAHEQAFHAGDTTGSELFSVKKRLVIAKLEYAAKFERLPLLLEWVGWAEKLEAATQQKVESGDLPIVELLESSLGTVEAKLRLAEADLRTDNLSVAPE